MMDVTSSIFYLTSAFQRPIIPDLISLSHPQQQQCHVSAPLSIPPIFDSIKPILAETSTGQDESPLDLSSKLMANNNNPPIRHASVIQHTKMIAQQQNVEILPTCFQPKIDMHRLQKIEGYRAIFDNVPQRQSDETSSTQSTSNRMSYPREFKLMVIDYFFANGQNKYRTCKE